MIQRINVVKNELELMLDQLDSSWKEKILYKWQYGAEHSEPNPRKIYDLKGFIREKWTFHNGRTLNTFRERGQFVVEEERIEGFIDILTNIDPNLKNRLNYNFSEEPEKISVEDLF